MLTHRVAYYRLHRFLLENLVADGDHFLRTVDIQYGGMSSVLCCVVVSEKKVDTRTK